jgi:hypothetical protein
VNSLPHRDRKRKERKERGTLCNLIAQPLTSSSFSTGIFKFKSFIPAPFCTPHFSIIVSSSTNLSKISCYLSLTYYHTLLFHYHSFVSIITLYHYSHLLTMYDYYSTLIFSFFAYLYHLTIFLHILYLVKNILYLQE